MRNPTVLLLLCFAGLAQAGRPLLDSERPPLLPAPLTLPQELPAERQNLSPTEAARRAQQQNGGGRVLSVEPASAGWRVKLLKDGEVRIVFVPN